MKKVETKRLKNAELRNLLKVRSVNFVIVFRERILYSRKVGVRIKSTLLCRATFLQSSFVFNKTAIVAALPGPKYLKHI